MRECPKPGVAFWATVVVVVAVLVLLVYPLSWGPFLLVTDHHLLPESVQKAGWRFYAPMYRIANGPHENDPLKVVLWYGLLWCR